MAGWYAWVVSFRLLYWSIFLVLTVNWLYSFIDRCLCTATSAHESKLNIFLSVKESVYTTIQPINARIHLRNALMLVFVSFSDDSYYHNVREHSSYPRPSRGLCCLCRSANLTRERQFLRLRYVARTSRNQSMEVASFDNRKGESYKRTWQYGGILQEAT